MIPSALEPTGIHLQWIKPKIESQRGRTTLINNKGSLPGLLQSILPLLLPLFLPQKCKALLVSPDYYSYLLLSKPREILVQRELNMMLLTSLGFKTTVVMNLNLNLNPNIPTKQGLFKEPASEEEAEELKSQIQGTSIKIL